MEQVKGVGICIECPNLSSVECPDCEHFAIMGQTICDQCSNRRNGECGKCATLRASAALIQGIAENHSLHELTYLGVDLRTINSLEAHLGILWLDQLVHIPRCDLEEVKNIGDVQINRIKWALNHYDQLEERKKVEERHLGKSKRKFDEKYRHGGVEFREESVN